jgi:hypothetical protein
MHSAKMESQFERLIINNLHENLNGTRLDFTLP